MHGVCGGGETADDSLGVRLLADIVLAFDGDLISTSALLDFLHDLDEAPWGDLRGKPLSPRVLADLLRPSGIRSRSVRIGDKTPKGFHREQFEDAWARYLAGNPPDKTPHRHNAVTTGDSGVCNPQQDAQCGGSKNGQIPHEHWGVADVADTGAERAPEDDERVVADLSDDELLAIFPGSTIEHATAATAEEEQDLERFRRGLDGDGGER